MRRLPFGHAVALGLLHGPTELLPVSSSGHTTLLPWLAGWPYVELDPESRKSFEVALHAGTAAALLLRPPLPAKRDRTSSLRERRPSRANAKELCFLLAGIAPAALTGYTLGGQIERRGGTPASIAAGLLGGSLAMLAGALSANDSRLAGEAGCIDGLLLGLAQALALVPGVSRSGATLAMARARGFPPGDADRLSWRIGLPVIAGAVALKGARLIRGGARKDLIPGLAPLLLAGGTSAFLSTLASTRVLDPERRAALLPACMAYRGALALLVVRRIRDNTSEHAILTRSGPRS
jgi:undecaprenyl-diphosphatase